jgi:hypothetical protein
VPIVDITQSKKKKQKLPGNLVDLIIIGTYDLLLFLPGYNPLRLFLGFLKGILQLIQHNLSFIVLELIK